MKATFGTLFTLLVAASAAPFRESHQVAKFSGSQLQSLLSVLAVHNVHGALDVDQNISCTVAYSLSLSTTGPPYTIDLASLDLSNCTYTGP
ncbi:hypothetical protein N7481_003381 [Penicillium waksmanii]|uniref:uncharacterized protein n=1 Tax=Penicillium waksmanii TaxID=69791 RepID=UPI0025466C92|nr:uncharacterized protein N7481_003381 [Penicillium waksmanii]KAJ5988171.1 hypothetical protein N7481_003381 [Penicillium waksmanii]